jgi:hypothetical protein
MKNPWKNRFFHFIFLVSIAVISILLAVTDEINLLIAWWLIIILLAPFLLVAIRTRYISLLTICTLSFTTQFFTLPNFYLTRESFKWGDIKPFDFTFLAALPIIGKIFIFLIFFTAFFIGLYRISIGSRLSNSKNQSDYCVSRVSENLRIAKRVTTKNSLISFMCIIFIVVLVTPLNIWMFSKGISIVGLESPHLPFRLSGILHYSTKYIIPIIMGYLYSNTRRNFLPMLVLLFYSWILGMSSVSRSALILVMLPVLVFALVDRRYLMLIVSFCGTLFGYAAVTLARSYVHVLAGGQLTGVISDSDILSILLDLVSEANVGLLDSSLLLKTFFALFDRIDGFENLVMSHYYNPSLVIGSFGFILRMISRRLVPWDQDLHHVQWQGFVLPEGFVNGGGLLSNAILLGNESLGWIVVSALVAASTLVILEKRVVHLFNRYGWPANGGVALICFMTITYFIETGGADVFVIPFLFILLLSFAPAVFRSKKIIVSHE